MIDDKTRAKVLREYAEKWAEISLETANCIRDDAEELDPPKPDIPDGTIAEYAMPNGTKVVGYKYGRFLTVYNDGVEIIAKVDEESLMPIRALGPGQVAVDRQAIVEAIAFLRFEEHIFSAERLQAALDRDKETNHG